MKKILLSAGLVAFLTACGGGGQPASQTGNPFFTEYTTPHGVPPFDQIKVEHYKPAFLQGMDEQKKEIEAILNQKEEPTFENTIVALDQSGKLLRKVSSVFYGLNSANTNDEMQALSKELSPLLSKHSDDISLNPELFKRVKAVYDNRASLGLDAEQAKLLEETYKDFERGGANLPEEKQARLRELNNEISMLQLTFGQNMLKETNAFKLVVEKEEDLAGLPADLIATAAETAKAQGLEGKWVFTLHNPSVMPFLQYAVNRDLRRQIFEGYINRGNNNNECDNKEVVKKLITVRLEKAKLMGYDDYAAFALENRMAKDEKNVYKLLDEIWAPALAKAKDELKDIQQQIKKEGGNFEAEGWDWRYYAEKAKQEKFNVDENEVRPYLQLDSVRQGAFYSANRLFGIRFKQVNNLPLPHPDAQAFECTDKDGTSLGVLYMDFFPRTSKRGGAWCGTYRSQSYENGKKIAPVVTVVCNFTPPAPGQPALLTVDEAHTLFHEFGHALHNFFKDVHYSGVSGVPRDFVELPSQLMEHWAFAPEVLKVYAKHYQTGEDIPLDIVQKIEKSGTYGQGFVTTEYLAASYLDMDYHVLTSVPSDMDIIRFEAQTLGKRGLLKQIPSRYRSTYFNHTMGGGYTAGYYSYIWAEVLEADAFEAFKETGDIFNQKVAGKYRSCILTPGGIKDAMDMYRDFRAKDPDTTPLLKNRGLK